MGSTLYIHGKKTVFEGLQLSYTEHVETTNDLDRMDSSKNSRLIQKRFFAIIDPEFSSKERGGRDGTYENIGSG
jgi:hypothetical protein